MSVLRHWDVYACPGECIGRSGLWNVAPKDMTCPNCGGTVEPMRVYQQPQGAVDDLREVARLLDRSTQTGKAPTRDEWAALALANATLDRLGGQ